VTLSSDFDLNMHRSNPPNDSVDAVLTKPLIGDAVQHGDAFHALARNSFDIVTRHGKDFRYLYVSPSIEPIAGIPATDFIGKTYRELGMPESVCQFWDQQLAHVFKEGQVHEVQFQMPGSAAYVTSRMIPEFDHGGEVNSVLIISREMSNERRQHDELQRVNAHLKLTTESANVGTWVMTCTKARLTGHLFTKKCGGSDPSAIR
jgi:hypothetical protein